jgi:hypothetical protein
MIPTTFQSQAVFLLPYRPDGKLGAEAEFEMLTTGSRARSGRASRAALRHTPVTSYRFTLQLFGDDVAVFNRGLKQLENKRVLCPFWPAAQLYSSPATHWASTGLWLTIEPSGDYEVHTAAAPSALVPSAAALKVPLMVGIFEKDPRPVLAKPTLATVQIRFIEDGPADYALKAGADASASGPALPGRTVKVFPLVADWSSAPAYGEAVVEIDRKRAGYTRRQPEVYYPQEAERILEMGVSTLTSTQSAALLAFFQARQGNVESFWIESPGRESVLTANTSAASAVIQVADTAAFANTRFLSFVRSGQPSVLREIISINAGAGTLTLNASPGTLPKDGVRLVALILARFSSASLSFKFVAAFKAEVGVSVRETPTEYTVPSGETYGATLGALPRVAQLYRFRLRYPGGDVVTRYTSYERDIIAASEVFTSLPGLTHGGIVDSLEIEKTTVKFQCRMPESGVLSKLSPYQLEVPLWIEVLECAPDASGAAGVPAMRFIGKVHKPRGRRPWLSFDAVHLLQDLDADVPTMLIQGADNNELFSPESGLSEANWTFTANVVSASLSGASITISTLARALGVPAIPAGYFRFGRVWKGSGSAYQSRTIVNSTEISGGQLIINLGQPFDGVVTGGLSLSPGYSGDPEEMRAKFGGYTRVCAFPFVPIGNPELIAVTQEQKTGKK